MPLLATVYLPPRDPSVPRVLPRRPANQFGQPRLQGGGESALATMPLGTGRDGALLLADRRPRGQQSAPQAQNGSELLPSRNGLMMYARTPRGEVVYLERSRWVKHIKPQHVTNAPEARGKRTTTWWPVMHARNGSGSMTEQQVLNVITDAVRLGHWQNAPKGTMLSVYELPADQAAAYGVSEVAVSTAPDGRMLSAYPTAGDNVLAVREVDGPDAARAAATAPELAASTRRPGRSTTFG